MFEVAEVSTGCRQYRCAASSCGSRMEGLGHRLLCSRHAGRFLKNDQCLVGTSLQVSGSNGFAKATKALLNANKMSRDFVRASWLFHIGGAWTASHVLFPSVKIRSKLSTVLVSASG